MPYTTLTLFKILCPLQHYIYPEMLSHSISEYTLYKWEFVYDTGDFQQISRWSLEFDSSFFLCFLSQKDRDIFREVALGMKIFASYPDFCEK